MKKILIISGSARSNSNTTQLIEHIFGKEVNHIELCNNQISQYAYSGSYDSKDDFQDIVDQMVAADIIVLSTPVYWYSMSGHMKAFMDRWTDLVTTHKEKGRALKGKKVALITQSTSEAMPEGFEIPFKLTAEYMDMEYIGGVFWDMRRPLEESDKLKHEIFARIE